MSTIKSKKFILRPFRMSDAESVQKHVGHKAEMGYWLGRKYWGGGMMTDAVKSIVSFGFKNLKLHRIYAGVFLFNKGSARVLEKNGFKLEGISKKEVKKDEEFIDAYIFAKVR